MAAPRSKLDRAVDAAMALAAEGGFRGLDLGAVARRARLTLPELYDLAPSRTALLEAALARIDRAMLQGGEELAGEPAHDRLFDAVMRRLDALRPWRDAVAAILRDLARDPPALLALLPAFGRSVSWTLRAAGLPCDGIDGLLRHKAISVCYLVTLRTWINDQASDQAATMAALDRALRRAEWLLGLTPARGWEATAPQAAAPAAAPRPKKRRRRKGN